LTLFAAGWILVQAAALLLLLMRYVFPELQWAAVQSMNLVQSVAFGAGIVYVVTGMALSCVVPAESGARLLAWGIIASLAISLSAWLLSNGAAYQNQEILQEIDKEIMAARIKKTGLPARAKLERILDQQWKRDTLEVLTIGTVAAFCLGKLLFTGFLWQLARHFRQQRLAGGILIYLLAEGFWAAVAVSILARQPGPRGINSPLVLLTGSWLPIVGMSAFCAWFLVNLFLVRRTITRALMHPNG
jgi:hypothetical protein